MISAPTFSIGDLMGQVRDAHRRVLETANQATKRVNDLDRALEPYRSAPDPHTALIEVLFNSRALEGDE